MCVKLREISKICYHSLHSQSLTCQFCIWCQNYVSMCNAKRDAVVFEAIKEVLFMSDVVGGGEQLSSN